MKQPVLGFAMCGSFCTYQPVLEALEELHTVFPDIIPIMSDVSFETDSRFGSADAFRARLEAICGHEILHTIPEVEPIGPKALCSTRSSLPLHRKHNRKACKRHCRHARYPCRQSPSSKRSAHHPRRLHQRRACRKCRKHRLLLNRKHYYFVPFRQDSPQKKPRSMVADFTKLTDAVCHAMQGEQIQPILL